MITLRTPDGVLSLSPDEAFAHVLVGYGQYDGDLKFKTNRLPIYLTKIAALLRDPRNSVV